MDDDRITPIETPIPIKLRRLEEIINSKESTEMEKQNDRHCPDHSGLVTEIKNLKEGLVDERKTREKSIEEIKEEFAKTNTEVGKVQKATAKITTIGLVLFIILQIGIKFIPFGGH
jgi:hypothetical protein